MAMHNHQHDNQLRPADMTARLNRAFLVGITLNMVFVVVEFAAGFILNSVALMSDAGHNLSDVISLALALMAFRLAKGQPTDKYTYGRKKTTVLVSFVNACLLLVAIGIILWESIGKIADPEPLPGGAVAWVAGVGILINGFTAWLLLRHRTRDINVKGAYLHMVADTLVSVGVLISGLIISYTGWYIIDPIIGIVIVVVIFISTWNLLKDSIRLSLDGVPSGIDLMEVISAVRDASGEITGVHHVHVWAISTTENALTAHLVVRPGSDITAVKKNVRRRLQDLDICHATLEIEDVCDLSETGCSCCDRHGLPGQ